MNGAPPAPPPRRPVGDAVRRAVDVAVAVVGLTVSAPVLAVAAAAIRLTMGSPVLFRQERSGLHGRPFTILKLRTMRHERYPGEPDPDRLTPVGSVLRTLSIDELPQLVNVLRGDMSIIGPRPTLPEQVARYGPRERGRLAIRPGITGWAQVNGRNSLSWPERIELDLWYIEHRSWHLDLRILLRTVLNLLRPEGITAEGGINPGYPGPDGAEGTTAERGSDPGYPGPDGAEGTTAERGSDRGQAGTGAADGATPSGTCGSYPGPGTAVEAAESTERG